MKRWNSWMPLMVKTSSCGATGGVTEYSGVLLVVEVGKDEDAAVLDVMRLHLSPRFTHLEHGIALSHCC